MKNSLLVILAALIFSCGPRSALPMESPGEQVTATMYLTTADSTQRLARQELPESAGDPIDSVLITIKPTERYQTMQGFGFTLTGGSAELIHVLPDDQRGDLLNELFGQEGESIGISYLRLSLGASDLDAEVFSYNDLPAGQQDPKLERFSLDPDRDHLIPVLKEILGINPEIKLMASPWSPPVWMKDNGSSKGGSLLPEYYPVYAQYFVRYIEGMAAEGIPIDAVTVQNEPLHPGNNPSLLMLAEDQATFVGEHLGPAFAAAGLDTRIVVYDHNADRPDYPITVLNDERARPYVDGAAFHLYGGVIEDIAQVHDAFPDKHLYFTEQWIGAPGNFAEDLKWHVRELIVKAPRHWSETVLEWNLAADENQDPHTEGGCTRCLGALTIDGDRIQRNTAYYIIAHASRFVPPGSVRIGSNVPAGLPNVAYERPDGAVVVIVLNDTAADRDMHFRLGTRTHGSRLPAGSAATVVLPGNAG
ncbi:glycoside hydrolase family 30 protein [Neolewinella litorea]|uniref:Glucosylceramidase n=1 Tax=Neolewinella litorea TaxID=2562452 RepID=A0A4S4NNG1_9BACT|nr:glycoside hydrolase family 30 beta sandwich domain-containing protein [Neolewinella litorea]THH41529.1 glucosylceramidase [Neolewinella litorea]